MLGRLALTVLREVALAARPTVAGRPGTVALPEGAPTAAAALEATTAGALPLTGTPRTTLIAPTRTPFGTVAVEAARTPVVTAPGALLLAEPVGTPLVRAALPVEPAGTPVIASLLRTLVPVGPSGTTVVRPTALAVTTGTALVRATPLTVTTRTTLIGATPLAVATGTTLVRAAPLAVTTGTTVIRTTALAVTTGTTVIRTTALTVTARTTLVGTTALTVTARTTLVGTTALAVATGTTVIRTASLAEVVGTALVAAALETAATILTLIRTLTLVEAVGATIVTPSPVTTVVPPLGPSLELTVLRTSLETTLALATAGTRTPRSAGTLLAALVGTALADRIAPVVEPLEGTTTTALATVIAPTAARPVLTVPPVPTGTVPGEGSASLRAAARPPALVATAGTRRTAASTVRAALATPRSPRPTAGVTPTTRRRTTPPVLLPPPAVVVAAAVLFRAHHTSVTVLDGSCGP
ncbi:hypothetical protein ACQEU3_33255 [Spirillospora sp. CA-253888]